VPLRGVPHVAATRRVARQASIQSLLLESIEVRVGLEERAIRWGMIGCGAVTEVKSGPAFQQARGSQLVAVMRRDGARAADYARRHNVPRWYNDAAALIEDPEVDAVYVATPPSSHLEYARLVAQAGKPVYVEKPMGRSYAECQKMIAACQQASVPLFVAYYRRALPRYLKVREWIARGALGEVRFVTSVLAQPPGDDLSHPWHLDAEISGGGRFFDVGCHALDLLDFLLGPIATVKGTAANQAGAYDAEDVVSGEWTFASGVHGVGVWCFTSGDTFDRTEIVGTRGTARFALLRDEPVSLSTPNGTTAELIDHPAHVQQPLVQSIVDQLLGVGTCPSTGTSASRTNWVMDEFLREYRRAHGSALE
jgi:1,5-anhydro-D-fructose reductase (1,5-anhydro-D-mannitol-forming)